MNSLTKIVCLFLSVTSVAQAVSTCKFPIEIFSNNDCSTKTDELSITADLKQCFTIANTQYHLKVEICDPVKYVIVDHFTDSSCADFSRPPMHAMVEHKCIPWDLRNPSNPVYVKMGDVDLTGNKYGYDWLEGFTIFICQTVLFGVCAGY